MSSLSQILNKFTYTFPPALIAQSPAHPRDSARLLVYNRTTQKINHQTFRDIIDFLPNNGVLVLNQTKVVPARLEVTKPTGGKARILYISHDSKFITALSDRTLPIGKKVYINNAVNFKIVEKHNQFYKLKPSFKTTSTFKVLDKYGQTPLPPYIKHSPLKGKRLKEEYQTVFAKQQGSVAAPTASLHFTKNLLKKIEGKGIVIKYITLHVNLGTFAPLTEQQINTQQLHAEHYEIDKPTAKFLNAAKQNNRPIIAVGTTVVRTLESATDTQGKLTKLSGKTTLFLNEKSKLHFVDQLITNFHVPKSSLLMLVAAFIGRKKIIRYLSASCKKEVPIILLRRCHVYKINSFHNSLFF